MKRVKLKRISQVELKTCHDIRHWAPCKGCGGLGDDRQMLSYQGAPYHGACLVALLDRRTILKLPAAELGKLTLGDTGAPLMKALVNRGAP
jgi:hypothetical protein